MIVFLLVAWPAVGLFDWLLQPTPRLLGYWQVAPPYLLGGLLLIAIVAFFQWVGLS